ncbi:MAG TPA: hypothetical protein VMT89_00695, partial [Candidatus Acidoferrales bacterium]|nr:hypothetical protein [Candidatus Acidoferrales bacterium]
MNRCLWLSTLFVAVTALGRVAGAQDPPARARPVVAIVALNSGTETTDFLVPYGVMAMSDAVELHALSVDVGPVELHPALKIQLDETLESFDGSHPGGADFVIVPALMQPSEPRLQSWLKTQASHGATMVAICD